jgi:hypothetical protein
VTAASRGRGGVALAWLEPCLSARHVRRCRGAEGDRGGGRCLAPPDSVDWGNGIMGVARGRIYAVYVVGRGGRGRMELPHLAIYDTAAGVTRTAIMAA